MKKELKKQIEDLKELEEAAMPLIKLLAKKYHPHIFVTVTNSKATLNESQMSTGQLFDYLVD